MIPRVLFISAERRLLKKGDLKQFASDLNEFHLRRDDPIAMAGSVVMAPAALILKGPNALVGAALNSRQADPLGEGPLAYTRRDVWSLLGNTFEAGKNLITLHPLRAGGNIIKGAFDASDLLTDPFLDAGAAIVGHTRRQVSNSLTTSA